MMKPPQLRTGDRLAVVSPSWGGPAVFPHRYEAGKRQLEGAFGVEVVEMPNALAGPAQLAADPAARADDLHRAFADPDIAGVVASIGGDDAIRLLPFLDLELLAANPKIFLGYSDSTIIHLVLHRVGIRSFYGPTVMSGFGENGGLHHYLEDGVRRTLFEPEAPLEWPENRQGWTVEFHDWADPSNQDRRRMLRPATGWRWHGGRVREGESLVACIEVLDWLRGTDWWPPLADTVLMLETSEEAPPPVLLTRFLRILALTGELQQLAGIVLGRPGGADLPVADHAAYDAAILQVVREEQRLHELPIVTNVDFGHTDPIWTVPQGGPTRIDPDTRTITFLDTSVAAHDGRPPLVGRPPARR